MSEASEASDGSSRPGLGARVRRVLRGRAGAGKMPEWWLIAVGAMIGLATGLGAIGFDMALHGVSAWAGRTQAGLPWWALPLIPMGGALVTGLLVYLFARDAEGHGVPQVLDAIIRKHGQIPARVGLVKALASIATVGSGGSSGAEGPIVQIGSTFGSVIARWVRLPREHVGTMVGCGAAAGISAIFNAPITGVFFALEILLRDFSLKTFTPVVIASVFATALTQVVLGSNEAIFSTMLPGYTFTLAELPSYVVLGVICGVVAVGFTKLLHVVEGFFAGLRVHRVIQPVIGAFLLGVLGVAFLAVLGRAGAEAGTGVLARLGGVHEPSFFGNGYAAIRALLEPGTFTEAFAGGQLTGVLVLLVVLVGVKALATTLTLGSRGSGGTFAPALFLGACTGGAFGVLASVIGLVPGNGSPASYALVGMAAVLAGTTFAPLTAILLLFEITREPLVLAPIMLAAIVATGVARSMMPDSIYTFHLRRAGVRIGTGADLSVLRRIAVSSVELSPLPAEPVYASDPLSKLITLHATYHVPDFPVVDAEGRHIGMVTGQDMRTALIDREAIPLLLVAEIMRTDVPAARADETLDVVLDRFARFDVSSLALVDAAARPVGLLTRQSTMAAYQRALEES